ncbi:hypothetical protein HY227_00660 [Candidatus Wolfebacteria bacterium]|nr:hypothetical protein [Candidatus Wolfebacteria bacterium]
MIIFLYGPDSYRRSQRIKEIINSFRGASRSLFADKKIAVIQNMSGEPTAGRGRKKSTDEKKQKSSVSDKKEFKKFLKFQLELKDSVLIISEGKAPTTDLKFLTLKPAISENFEELSGQKLKEFIKKESSDIGLALKDESVNFLAESFKSDSWGLVNELAKISCLKESLSQKPIGIETIKSAGDYTISENLFYFINMFSYEGGLQRKIASIERLLFSKEEPAKIFNFLASRPTTNLAALERFANYDVAIKSGKLDYEEVLLDLVLT